LRCTLAPTEVAALPNWPPMRQKGMMKTVRTSFCEQKEAKKLLLLWAWASNRPAPQAAIHRGLFASFSSEKEMLK
jgi:hypothetical protein